MFLCQWAEALEKDPAELVGCQTKRSTKFLDLKDGHPQDVNNNVTHLGSITKFIPYVYFI